MNRAYGLGKRQVGIDRTRQAILDAARELVQARPSSAVSVAAVAERAGVARVTVYNRFGSRAGLLLALAPESHPSAPGAADPREAIRDHLSGRCLAWAASPALFRHLAGSDERPQAGIERGLAERLAAADALRPGCSIREAEDVIAALGSFVVFDHLHKDGRRAPAAVAEILMRLVAGILA